jgi:predicted permease
LMVNSFTRMERVDPGFDPRQVLVAEMELPPKYKTPESITQFSDAIIEKTAAIGGVERSAVAMYTPFSEGGNVTKMMIEGHPAFPSGQEPLPRRNFVTPGYLETLNIRLLAGRTIARSDAADSLPVVVINDTIAKRYFANENPLGQKIRLGAKPAPFTIVGVVKEIKYYNLSDPPADQVYVAFAQGSSHSISLIARASGDTTAIAQSMRAVVHAVDPNQPVSRIVSIETHMNEVMAGSRILTQIVGFFGVLALFLAAIGIYGVMAYTVSQRGREIGIRMALGARGREVLMLIVRQGMTIVLGGMVVGVAGAFAMARLLTRWLTGIESTDPATYAASFAILAIAALLACWIPARRAARLNPVDALRSE